MPDPSSEKPRAGCSGVDGVCGYVPDGGWLNLRNPGLSRENDTLRARACECDAPGSGVCACDTGAESTVFRRRIELRNGLLSERRRRLPLGVV